MTEFNDACLEAFPKWLASLNEDAVAMASLLVAESIPVPARRHIAGAINYLFKSLDIIPDSIQDLGYLDDAFVLRVAALFALDVPGTREADGRGVLAGLASDTAIIKQLLEGDYQRLERYVRTLAKGASRGRTVDEVLADPSVRSETIRELHAWSRQYEAPRLSGDDQMLIKLKSFLLTRLP